VSVRSFTINPGNELTQSLGFTPIAVVVDNFTPYWLFLQDAGRYVPPFTTGAILPVSHVTQAYVSWKSTPFGNQLVAGATVGNYTATTVWTDEKGLGYSGGTAVANPFVTRYQQGPGVDRPDITVFSYNGSEATELIPVSDNYFADGQQNESYDYIRSRQLLFVKNYRSACLAGVLTNIGFMPNNNLQRILWMIISVSVATEVTIDMSVYGAGLYAGFVAGNTSVPVKFDGNGLNLNGSAASTLTALCVIASTVQVTAGFGMR
jgi:hypothetical protein